jgi:hypothetical protein
MFRCSFSRKGRATGRAACEDFINVISSSSDYTLYKGTLSSGVKIAVVSTLVNSAKDWTERSEEQFKNKVIMRCAKLYMVNVNRSCFRYLFCPE